jgi:hypothetical protein
MTLSTYTTIDKIEVLEFGTVQIREAEVITKDGVEIARNFHRSVVNPGEDVSTQDAKVKAICEAVWTSEVISAYQAQVASQAKV